SDKVLKALKAAQEKGPTRGVGVMPTTAPSPWPSRLITWQPDGRDKSGPYGRVPVPAKGGMS
ncbi:MAG TPA: hypothetical protein VFN02_07305, partial [Ktedonobacteraceae bacterium]|nr:hypothetical protein [Ktedonobacteraceae bacterium]